MNKYVDAHRGYSVSLLGQHPLVASLFAMFEACEFNYALGVRENCAHTKTLQI